MENNTIWTAKIDPNKKQFLEEMRDKGAIIDEYYIELERRK